jgi:hypothetical protein
MTIYRKFAEDPPNDVHANRNGPRVDKSTPPDETKEGAERTKRRNAVPVDEPLPRTFKWIAKLPRDIRPIQLMRAFPRIANLMSSVWNEPESMHSYFDELLVDRREKRKGFPPDVMVELLALRNYYTDLHRRPAGAWEDLDKRS